MVLLALLPAAHADDEQVLVFQVAVPGDRLVESMTATVSRAGEPSVLVTLGDGIGESAGSPFDGIWTGQLGGPAARYAQVVLELTPTGGEPAVAFHGVVLTEDLPAASIGFRVSAPPEAPRARRAVFALPGHAAEEEAARPVWAAFGWLWAAIFWVGAMVANAQARREP